MHELMPQAYEIEKSFSQESHVPCLLQTPLISTQPSLHIRTFFKTILALGPRIVVVTNGAEGVYVAQSNKIYFHPSLGLEVVSTPWCR